MDVTLNLSNPMKKQFAINGTDLAAIAQEIRRRNQNQIGFRFEHEIAKILGSSGPVTGARIRAKPFIQAPKAKKASALSADDRRKWKAFEAAFVGHASRKYGEYASRIQDLAARLRKKPNCDPREFDLLVRRFEKQLDSTLGRGNASRDIDRLLRIISN